MANVNNAFGFRPLMTSISGAPCRVQEYSKVATDAQVLCMFDLVWKVAASLAASYGSPMQQPIPAVKSYYTATPGTTLILGASLNASKASTAAFHYVVDNIDALFAVQSGGNTSITVASHVGKNAPVLLTTVGSTTTLVSGMQIDGANIATTGTLDMRIMELLNLVGNAEGANAILEVSINKHALGQGVTAI